MSLKSVENWRLIANDRNDNRELKRDKSRFYNRFLVCIHRYTMRFHAYRLRFFCITSQTFYYRFNSTNSFIKKVTLTLFYMNELYNKNVNKNAMRNFTYLDEWIFEKT